MPSSMMTRLPPLALTCALLALAPSTVCAQAAAATATQLHLLRTGSIARYGNPYGQPARDIAFPLLRTSRTRTRAPAVPAPYPIPGPGPSPAPAPEPGDDQQSKPRPGRLYATYTLYNRTTGLHYSGRTSAVIDLDQDWDLQAEAAVQARNGNRETDENAEPGAPGFNRAALEKYAVGLAVDYGQRYRDAAYLTIRGREQQLIDYHGAQRAQQRGIASFRGGARSDTNPDEPLTENAIRGVARDNPFGQIFHAAANLHFGLLAPYTGRRRFHE